MIKSMTGFGRCELAEEGRKVTVEMKAVNHRYSEFSVKLPKRLNVCDVMVRNILKQYISRGKVDVFVSYEDETEGKGCVKYNAELAKEYYDILMRMAEEFPIENDIRISGLSRYPEVLTIESAQQDEEALYSLLERAVKGACEQFVETRIAEGERLRADLTAKCEKVSELVAAVEERSPQIMAEYRKKLTDKVAEVLGDTKIDERVLATEITIYADKICTDEETVRLRSHVANMLDTFKQGENIGRKLDFVAQEMNREANTILSKANDITVSNIAIDLKTEIEKIREQIQNIE
ncbi:MAG: YicC family protein [Lachnospiraceae bacterium]|nr:YicC family protein [Lachnospiraceae bacterium]